VELSIASSVRRARPSDAAALADLVNRAYAIEAYFVDGQRTTAEEIAALIRTGGFVVLEYAGGICGGVMIHGPGQHAGRAPRHADLGMLSVLPELQGIGLGRRLVRVAEAMAEAAGAAAMDLRVINLRDQLSRWYRSLGYREVGTAPYHHRSAKRPCHFIEMTKALTPVGAIHSAADVVAMSSPG
jgi:ribosomal protein S18 acetylase RimI-like enzyme